MQSDSTAIPPCPYCKIAELEAERDKAVNVLKNISYNLNRVDEQYDDFSFYCDTRALIKDYLAPPEALQEVGE
jgi:hypothetical protein